MNEVRIDELILESQKLSSDDIWSSPGWSCKIDMRKQYYQKVGLCKGYPSELLKWTFDWEYMVRGLVLDKKTSLIFKVNYLASLDYRFHRANIILYQTLFRVE
ncbi:hypothetical protein GIB67_023839 [Kingdonia uniflora]|uniref:Uncharacterized protein n=1 Tax=Kingdonia uniflora TaxID=39325 RepID=A0A7J7NFW2_9MAGN|nr:hypothetical protein GIB67_023839 [Kingdonia uniflora]